MFKIQYLVVIGFALAVSGVSRADIMLSNGSPTYTQDFNTLASAGTSSILPADWAMAESDANANSDYTAGDGSSTTGDTYSFGSVGSSERALGGLQSSNLVPLYGASFANGGITNLLSVSVSYLGELWRRGSSFRPDFIDFQYSTDATTLTNGTWIDVDALDYASAGGNPAGALNGNANQTAIAGTITFGAPLAPGSTFKIRFVDRNISGVDDGQGIDDFSITGNFAAIPEPSTLGLLGVLGLAFAGIRRKRD